VTVLVAGLGNPGAEYARTRHNAGWMLADRLAALLGVSFTDTRWRGEVAEGKAGREAVVLLKPHTFMNLSGESVLGAMRALGIGPERVVVAVDELHLPTGTLKVTTGGSDGGHNGLKSVDASLATPAYRRLRIGVGPHPKGEMRDFVLSPFREDEFALLGETLALGAESLLAWAKMGADERAYGVMVAAANQKAKQPLEARRRAEEAKKLAADAAAKAPATAGQAISPAGDGREGH
jgi:PTH1 family peptidyl-tRNA hydrolase